ncbi:hypothetical protein [Catellatospora sichuanensis]|uniref:hypothetical protein n=1 Tax=Catellatospora sichuanensis TaxID=1969805 RepID=UPI001182E41A|nr:hypothetical protein [Catellatospora sichuanensis]
MTAPENKPSKRRWGATQWALLGLVLAALIGVTVALLNQSLPGRSPVATGSAPPPPAATGSGPPPAATPSAAPSPSPVGFQLTSAAAVPRCADLTGQGSKPPGREVGLFVQRPGDPKYYWEKLLKFDGDTWRAERVVIGTSGDSGKDFNLVLVPMSGQAVAEFSKHDGTAYAVENPPVAPIATFRVTRTTTLGSC